MNVVVVYGDRNACYQYRIKEPYENLKCGINFVLCQQLGESGFTDSSQIEAVLFQRPCNEAILNFMRAFNKEGKISVIETDDDINHLPHSNPAHRAYPPALIKTYNQFLKEATYVHVTTPELKRGEKYVVFPNAVDLSKYDNS